MARRDRPTLRLLFDELLPWRVAEALLVLGFNTSHVGNERHGQPQRTSSDADVLAHAAATNQVVVTSNHDMVMLCAEQQQSVVWIDPRGRQLRSDEFALMAFAGIEDWQRQLEMQPAPVCLRVMRTKTELLSLDRAQKLAERRMNALRAKRAAKQRRRPEVTGQIASV